MSTTGEAPSSGEVNIAHVVMIAAAAAMGGFLFGYDSAVINGAVSAIQDTFRVGSTVIGFTVAAALIGSAVGAAIAGALADRIGRIRVMQLAAVLFAASAVGSALPFTVWDLAWWRVVGGVAIGIASVIAPTYIAEVSPPAFRGRLASLQQLAIVLGIATSQLVNYGLAAAVGGSALHRLGPLQAWQWMLGIEVLPAATYFVLTLVIPESPRHLVRIGRDARARRVLAEVEGGDVDGRVAEIRRVLGRERRPRLRDLRGRYGLLAIVWVGMALSAFQQLVGINVIFYYSAVLWQSVGIAETDSLLLSLFTSIVNIVGTLIAIGLVDRVGRKPLLLAGSAGMTVALAFTAFAFSHARGEGDDVVLSTAWALTALVSASTFVLFFALSWGVVTWVLLGEMFPLRIRAAAMAVATATQWITNWLVTVTFPSLRDWSLPGTYLVYTAFALLSFGFVLRFVRETKGRTLESMDELAGQ
ncbi:sugar porter family MFS transporter [Thermobifida fusca]|uniref:Sugar transporter n=1 Tax=Thermobifida fusca (strain YX) TaxID=269800 RepID=Q47PB6_THEFY|nr:MULTISPECIES: sugar porter family MFS transporter [Thermobifida]AAZ55703.1 sugar transporter [Thermobifida fusca YX]MBO2529174.1 MFS transporter [Thermobifida sp.]PPS94616.1 major facilitator transporter [Thermobifida fusca]